jgi:hypothetical protein
MDGLKYPKLLGAVNGILRAILWTALGLDCIGIISLMSTPGEMGKDATPFLTFVTIVSVLAILYTLDALIAAVGGGAPSRQPSVPVVVPSGYDSAVDLSPTEIERRRGRQAERFGDAADSAKQAESNRARRKAMKQ